MAKTIQKERDGLRILQICHRTPFPPFDGGNIAMMNLSLALHSAGNDVHQFALNTSKHFVSKETYPKDLFKKLNYGDGYVDTSIQVLPALKNIIGSGSYNVERFYSKNAAAKIITKLQEHEFDVVQLETIFASPYLDDIRANTNAKIVLRAHNVEHIIWQRLSESVKNPFKKWYIKFLSERLKKYELELCSKIDAMVPITNVDEKVFLALGLTKPVYTIPVCLNPDDYPDQVSAKPPLILFHLGSMDWLPNIEAIEWFIKNCWGEIHKELPTLKLVLAGRNFPKELMNLISPNATCIGRIEDSNQFMSDKQLMLVPLLSGSGMRVKIIQGLALGKTIISTSIGAEGVDITHRKNILIADHPEDFLLALKKCVSEPEWCYKIGQNARKLFTEKYSIRSVGNELTDFYKSLIEKNK